HLRVAFSHRCASLAAVEKIVSQLKSEGAEVVRQKRDIVLITVASKRRDVWHIVSLGQLHGGVRLSQFLARRYDFWMRLQSDLDALLALASIMDAGNAGIQIQLRRQRQPGYVVQLHGQVRELQLSGQQFL